MLFIREKRLEKLNGQCEGSFVGQCRYSRVQKANVSLFLQLISLITNQYISNYCHPVLPPESHQVELQVQFLPLEKQKPLHHFLFINIKSLTSACWILGLGLVSKWHSSELWVSPTQITWCGGWRRGWAL